MNTPRWIHRSLTLTLMILSLVLARAAAAPTAASPDDELRNATLNSIDQGGLSAWQMTTAMSVARQGHSATLLPDGRVLAVAAGGDATADPAEGSIEAYDPDSQSWEALASIRPPRRNPSTLLLPDGRVLIVGGDGGPGQPFPIEALFFDPDTSTLTSAGPMSSPRVWHTSTLLPDGSVMVVGGGNPGFLSSIERWNPQSGQWAEVGQLEAARVFHTTTLLPDGDLLAVGGAGSGGRLDSIERIDPQSGASDTIATLHAPRAFHSATLLEDGRVLIAGGDNGSGTGFPPHAEIIDPDAGTVVETAPMLQPRRQHDALRLPDGRVLIVGGDHNSPLADTELYDTSSNSWTEGPALNEARRHHSTTLLDDGGVLVAGGFGAGARLASAERLLPRPCDVYETIDVASTKPAASFIAMLEAGSYKDAIAKDLASTTIDRYVAHSFTGLKQPGMRIMDAKLSIVAEPGGGGSSNDALHVLVSRTAWATSPRISRYFGAGKGTIPGLKKNSGWTQPGATTIDIVIDSGVEGLPVLDAMNNDGRLDWVVQDDTTIHAVTLTVHYVCCDVWRSLGATESEVGPELDAYLDSIGHIAGKRKGFGDTQVERTVGHTFELPTIPGATITKARLRVSAKPAGNGETIFADSPNDAIHAMVAPGPGKGWSIESPPQGGTGLISNFGSWKSGGPAKTLDTGVFTTSSDPGLLNAMNAAHRLDVYVQDDTTVFSMRLDLFFACCGGWRSMRSEMEAAPSSELHDYMLAIGALNGIKGFGSPTTNSIVGHSFVSLQRPGMHIGAIEMIVQGPAVGGSNDTASVLVAPDSATRTDWSLASHWDSLNDQTVPLKLEHNAGNNSFFAQLNDTGRLDMYVQDDTQVDRVILALRYDCGPFQDLQGPGPDIPPWTYLEPDRADLWMEDTPYIFDLSTPVDVGDEADATMIAGGHPYWQSRAIWVRNQAFTVNTTACSNTDGQNPLHAGNFENTLCVRVHNRGKSIGNGTLRLYWAKQALGLGWDDVPWQSGTTNGDWTEITSASIPISIPPKSVEVFALPWAPPDPMGGSESHVCLLARIEAAPGDHIWTETDDVNYNTMWNNNIAWRNVHVVRDIILGEEDMGHPVVVRNVDEVDRAVAVSIRPLLEGGRQNFLDVGSLVLRMPRGLFDRWSEAGAGGTGFRLRAGEPVLIIDDPTGASVEDLPLGAREAEELRLSFEAYPRTGSLAAPLDTSESYEIELTQSIERDGLDYEQGGVAYAIRPAPPASGRLTNISTRGWVGPDPAALIGGFIVDDAPASAIIRAIGPSLGSRGVPNPLTDPWLEVYDGDGQLIATCHDWRDCAGAGELGGLAPDDPREAALKLTLEPGRYTAVLRYQDGRSGIGLVEVFHAGGGGSLSNLSTRGMVRVDDEVLIGGFILADYPGEVIIRAIGPDLIPRGVQDALLDPWIEIYDAAGQPIATCRDWQDCQGASELGALAPADPREAALKLSLEPGAYTAIVRGEQRTTGIGLVEVFRLR